jgi:hypothetical protein
MGVIAMSATPTEESQSRKEVISNACHWHAFPPSPRTLWEYRFADYSTVGTGTHIGIKACHQGYSLPS